MNELRAGLAAVATPTAPTVGRLCVPVVINNRNWLSPVREMVAILQKWEGIGPIVIIDNDSTYPPLMEWYRTQRAARVVCLPYNMGHAAPFTLQIAYHAMWRYYVVTDPDLDISRVPGDCLAVLARGLRANPDVVCAGLSLRVDDIPEDCIFDRGHIWREESPNRAAPLVDGFRSAGIDTTFAMYDNWRDGKHDWNVAKPCIRSDPPYMARHLPWYLTPDTMTDEARYYFDRADSKSCSSKARMKC